MDMRFLFSAAALIAMTGLFNCSSLGQIREANPPSPTTRPAHDPAGIPVKQVVLFSSGVGYFEHAGKVTGDVATELRFKTDQINDILKSLLLQDMDGGTINTVSYPGLAPLAHTLKSFQVDITANPDMADLLSQLRGAKLTVMLDDNRKMSGVILGVEKKMQASGDKAVVEIITLNLKVDRQFRSINIARIESMELDDPELQKELDDALAALAQSRDQDKKPMTLHFSGKGERHVRIGYLVETPIWKTSYRLVLGADALEKKHGQSDPAGPATAPAMPATTKPAAAAASLRHRGKIQGWAIVENQTDNDWNDVELSLVSGRPLSFIQDLYHSQYIPRPVVQANNYASLRPQTYAGGIFDLKDLVSNVPNFTDAPDFSLNLNSTSNNQSQNPQGGGGIVGSGLIQDSGGARMIPKGGPVNPQQQAQQAPIDPTTSIISAATAARVGELFKYHVGNVSLARQTSAMISIVTDDIEAERISIYNAAILSNHPLLGVRVKNNTGKYLLQGPITVLDHGSYAGDARIEDLPPGQERLLSFGIDQQVLMDATGARQESASVTAKIVKGIITLTSRNVVEQAYLADNKSDETRMLVIEHPREPEFKLVAPVKAEETTPELFRFRRPIEPHKTAKLVVVQEHVFDTRTQILSLVTADIAAYLKDGAIPQNVRDALVKAIALKDQVSALKARIAESHHQMDSLFADQGRIRDNLKAVAGESDYYKRLMKKIDEQESAIEKVQKTIADLQETNQAAEKQLNDYIANLTVGE